MIKGQQIFPPQILELPDRFTTTLEEFQKQIELIVKYDWDFDHYLEEDVPAAVRQMFLKSIGISISDLYL